MHSHSQSALRSNSARNFRCAVNAAVTDDMNVEQGTVVGLGQSVQSTADHGFFIVCGDNDGDHLLFASRGHSSGLARSCSQCKRWALLRPRNALLCRRLNHRPSQILNLNSRCQTDALEHRRDLLLVIIDMLAEPWMPWNQNRKEAGIQCGDCTAGSSVGDDGVCAS
jgi:hypothetical protein